MKIPENLIPLIDSRKLVSPSESIFFAIKGPQNDGHKYISFLYNEGVKHFVIENDLTPFSSFPKAHFYKVNSSVECLQEYTADYRENFKIPVIAITGSNGKTIVKEWLSQLLSLKYSVAKSPRSYNSQVGVPLSIFEIKPFHDIGVFEAGISLHGEMPKLERVIKPSIGIFTNIGSAHDQGFESRTQKIDEKLTLFNNCEILIFRNDDKLISDRINFKRLNTLSWSLNDNKADINFKVIKNEINIESKKYQILKQNLVLPPSASRSIENICHCIATLIYLDFSFDEIKESLNKITPVSMRMEVKQGINNCVIIDDTYNNDLYGLKTALELFEQNNQQQLRTVILSDLFQSGLSDDELYQEVNTLLNAFKINKLIAVGEHISNYGFDPNTEKFKSTEEFLNNIPDFKSEVILVKGARKFHFEKIVKSLTEKQHRAYLDINLNALVANLNFYREQLDPSTKIMVMVKAFAYGSGSNEVANLLQYNRIDYLAVAYADEGVELRKNGITIPIMVMNPNKEDFGNLLKYDLEPEIYSLNLLDNWTAFIQNKDGIPNLHLKLDTGMHRLGFELSDVEKLIEKINYHNLNISSIFSHLASADDNTENDFTNKQIDIFEKIASEISTGINQHPLYHILNSSGILAHPEAQFNMVRLGIGLYGYDPTNKKKLQVVASLYAQISQIKTVSQGDTIGYSRSFKANRDMQIGTINIGYADGISRQLSNGKGKVWINGQTAPIVGNVCMDMIMVDLTGIDCEVGDQVEIFGSHIPLTEIADSLNTISYEILTSISERVKRIYFRE